MQYKRKHPQNTVRLIFNTNKIESILEYCDIADMEIKHFNILNPNTPNPTYSDMLRNWLRDESCTNVQTERLNLTTISILYQEIYT